MCAKLIDRGADVTAVDNVINQPSDRTLVRLVSYRAGRQHVSASDGGVLESVRGGQGRDHQSVAVDHAPPIHIGAST